jgi:hypothetical protein
LLRHDTHASGTTLADAGLTLMETSAQYREFAEECLCLAKQAKDKHQRNILKEMAEVWNKLAEAAHKKK